MLLFYMPKDFPNKFEYAFVQDLLPHITSVSLTRFPASQSLFELFYKIKGTAMRWRPVI